MTNLFIAILYGSGVLGLIAGLDFVSVEWLPWWLNTKQGWLILIALATFYVFYRHRPSNHALVLCAVYPLALACVSVWDILGYTDGPTPTWELAVDLWGNEWEVWTVGLTSLVFIYVTLGMVFVVFWPIHRADIMAKAMYVFLWAGELYMIIENWTCNVILPSKGSDVIQQKILDTMLKAQGLQPEGFKQACSRAFEAEWIVWASPVVQILILAVMVFYFMRAKPLPQS